MILDFKVVIIREDSYILYNQDEVIIHPKHLILVNDESKDTIPLTEDMVDFLFYSGINDDNGEKIYDGDIVQVWNKKETDKPHISIVEISEHGYGVVIRSHPELMKSGKSQFKKLREYVLDDDEEFQCIKIGNFYTHQHLYDQYINQY